MYTITVLQGTITACMFFTLAVQCLPEKTRFRITNLKLW